MVMDLMVMEREMLSPVMDTELVMVLLLLLTIHMVDPARIQITTGTFRIRRLRIWW